MRISDWSSDVCSSDLEAAERGRVEDQRGDARHQHHIALAMMVDKAAEPDAEHRRQNQIDARDHPRREHRLGLDEGPEGQREPHREIRSEEHTSELQSLMRISYAVFCLKKKKQTQKTNVNTTQHRQITTN